jgi:hypothetical protein
MGSLPDFPDSTGLQQFQGRMARAHYLAERINPSSTHSQPLPKDLEGKPFKGRIRRQDLECFKDIEKMIQVMFHFPLCPGHFTSLSPYNGIFTVELIKQRSASSTTILFREPKMRIWKALGG